MGDVAKPLAAFLDVGGVMVLPLADHVGEVLEIRLDAATAAKAHYLAVSVFDTKPRNPREAYFETYAAVAGVAESALPVAVSRLERLWSVPSIDLWRQVIDGPADGLRAIAQTGIRLGVISNSDGTVEAQLRQHCLCQVGSGPGVRVEVIADSFVIGYAKPDPRIFEYALEELGIRPDEAVYVGDSAQVDVSAAERMGMGAIHFDPYELCGDRTHTHASSLSEVAVLCAD